MSSRVTVGARRCSIQLKAAWISLAKSLLGSTTEELILFSNRDHGSSPAEPALSKPHGGRLEELVKVADILLAVLALSELGPFPQRYVPLLKELEHCQDEGRGKGEDSGRGACEQGRPAHRPSATQAREII